MYKFQTFLRERCWWGKILGFFFGYLIGRSVGAIIGLLIGNFFDKALCQHLARPFSSFYTEKNRDTQHLFLEVTFLVAGFIAKSDGRVSEQEIQTAQSLMMSLKLSKKQKQMAQDYFNMGKSSTINLDPKLALFKATCRNNPQLIYTFVNIQYAIAQVDGLTDKKIAALNRVLIILGLAPLNRQHRFYEDFDYRTSQRNTRDNYRYESWQRGNTSSRNQQQNPFKPAWNSLAEAHTILGTKPDDSEDTVKKAYRRLISQNHPDKLIAQGASEAAIKNANNKTQAIRKAYEQICASKGW